MPNLVHRRLPPIIPINRIRTPRHTPGQNIAPIDRIVLLRILVLLAIERIRDGGWQGAVAEQGGAARGVGRGGEV